MTKRKQGRLNQFSRRMTGGKLVLGAGRRQRRSKRLKLYESSASFALPKAPRPTVAGLRRRLWLPVALLALTADYALGRLEVALTPDGIR